MSMRRMSCEADFHRLQGGGGALAGEVSPGIWASLSWEYVAVVVPSVVRMLQQQKKEKPASTLFAALEYVAVVVPSVVRMLQQQEGETRFYKCLSTARVSPSNPHRAPRSRKLSCLPPSSVPLRTTLQLHSGFPNLIRRLTAPPVVELNSLPTK